MSKLLSILLIFLLIFLLLTGAAAPVWAADQAVLAAALHDTAEYVYRTVQNPQVGPVGGEWAVLGLARSGYNLPQSYYDAYYKTVAEHVQSCRGILDERKYTEYSRLILALTAAGFDPCNVAGYDLTLPLGDFAKTVWQGINGPIFALIALDSAGYALPQNPAAATRARREMYVTEILNRQLPDGGFALSSSQTTADADITGMALQALAKYRQCAGVEAAIGRALHCLAEMEGRFVSGAGGAEGSESIVQVIIALGELGIGIADPRFIKDGKTLADRLLQYYVAGQGFERFIGGGVNQMATEQALNALAALYRNANGLASLYDLSATSAAPPPKTAEKIGKDYGLPGKDEAIRGMPLAMPHKTFPDIAGNENRAAIESLAARGIISGKSETQFAPDAKMTRAEFATIITRGLGLAESESDFFNDVRPEHWFFGYVGTAYRYGIVSGISATAFNPNGMIRREEAATMITRAAKLCGMNTVLDEAAVRDTLAQFGDQSAISGWARQPLAFCYGENILSPEVFEIKPGEAIRRGEIAGMLYRMLAGAGLL